MKTSKIKLRAPQGKMKKLDRQIMERGTEVISIDLIFELYGLSDIINSARSYYIKIGEESSVKLSEELLKIIFKRIKE